MRKEDGKQNWGAEGRGKEGSREEESDILGYREISSSVERINNVVAFIAELSRKWSD